MRHLEPMDVGRMFGISGVVTIIIQGGLIGRLVRRFGEGALVPVGVALLSIGLALLGYAPATLPMVGVFCIIAIGQGIATPSLHSLISRGTSEDEQGFVLGTNQSMSALARVVGPGLGGVLFSSQLGHASPFTASAILLGLAVFLAIAAVHQRTRADAQPAT